MERVRFRLVQKRGRNAAPLPLQRSNVAFGCPSSLVSLCRAVSNSLPRVRACCSVERRRPVGEPARASHIGTPIKPRTSRGTGTSHFGIVGVYSSREIRPDRDSGAPIGHRLRGPNPKAAAATGRFVSAKTGFSVADLLNTWTRKSLAQAEALSFRGKSVQSNRCAGRAVLEVATVFGLLAFARARQRWVGDGCALVRASSTGGAAYQIA
jgi:hypothetical protein